jgi:hypothetical protein
MGASRRSSNSSPSCGSIQQLRLLTTMNELRNLLSKEVLRMTALGIHPMSLHDARNVRGRNERKEREILFDICVRRANEELD